MDGASTVVQLLKVGEVARLTGLSVKTLHHYEEHGPIRGTLQDADTGERYQELRPPVHYGRYGPPGIDVCIQGALKALIYGQGRRVLETTFFG